MLITINFDARVARYASIGKLHSPGRESRAIERRGDEQGMTLKTVAFKHAAPTRPLPRPTSPKGGEFDQHFGSKDRP